VALALLPEERAAINHRRKEGLRTGDPDLGEASCAVSREGNPYKNVRNFCGFAVILRCPLEAKKYERTGQFAYGRE